MQPYQQQVVNQQQRPVQHQQVAYQQQPQYGGYGHGQPQPANQMHPQTQPQYGGYGRGQALPPQNLNPAPITQRAVTVMHDHHFMLVHSNDCSLRFS